MKMKRFLGALGIVVLGTTLLAGCSKKDGAGSSSKDVKWPTKAVTVTLPYKAGGDTDVYCRLMSKRLSDKFKQNFVVVNMTGGSGIVAAKTIMAAKPDGYNILFNHSGASLVQEATGVADFSYTDNFTNVATVVRDDTYVLVAKKEKGWKDLKALIAYAKAHPGEVRYSVSYGSATHYVLSRMEETMGIKFNALDVGTGSAERLAALMGDQVDVMVVNYLNVKDYIEKGDFVVYGVCAPERNPGMEKIPTFKEQGYDVVSSKIYEVKFPKGTDAAIVDKLSSAIEEITKDPSFKEELKKYYAVPYYRNAEQMNKNDEQTVEELKKYFKK